MGGGEVGGGEMGLPWALELPSALAFVARLHVERVLALICILPTCGTCPSSPLLMQGFTRLSQLEPENGEAWNNLAAVHMHMEHWAEALNALGHAVRHKRDSWQTWENYARVAVGGCLGGRGGGGGACVHAQLRVCA